jgi:hypothetical protein
MLPGHIAELSERLKRDLDRSELLVGHPGKQSYDRKARTFKFCRSLIHRWPVNGRRAYGIDSILHHESSGDATCHRVHNLPHRATTLCKDDDGGKMTKRQLAICPRHACRILFTVFRNSDCSAALPQARHPRGTDLEPTLRRGWRRKARTVATTCDNAHDNG